MTFEEANARYKELYDAPYDPSGNSYKIMTEFLKENFFVREPRVHLCKTCAHKKECYVKKHCLYEVPKCKQYE